MVHVVVKLHVLFAVEIPRTIMETFIIVLLAVIHVDVNGAMVEGIDTSIHNWLIHYYLR